MPTKRMAFSANRCRQHRYASKSGAWLLQSLGSFLTTSGVKCEGVSGDQYDRRPRGDRVIQIYCRCAPTIGTLPVRISLGLSKFQKISEPRDPKMSVETLGSQGLSRKTRKLPDPKSPRRLHASIAKRWVGRSLLRAASVVGSHLTNLALCRRRPKGSYSLAPSLQPEEICGHYRSLASDGYR
jgi:hypothetical protein